MVEQNLSVHEAGGLITPRDIQGWFSEACGATYRRECLAQVRWPMPCLLVEVGCWKGKSLSYLAEDIREGTIIPICCDTWKGSGDPSSQTYKQDVHEEFLTNMQKLGIAEKVLVERMASVALAKSLEFLQFHVVMIDADHRPECVQEDVNTWWPRIAAGGVLMGHDAQKDSVKTAVEALAEREKKPVEVERKMWIVRK